MPRIVRLKDDSNGTNTENRFSLSDRPDQTVRLLNRSFQGTLSKCLDKITQIKTLKQLEEEGTPEAISYLLKSIKTETDEDILFETLKTVTALCPISLSNIYSSNVITEGLYDDRWEKGYFDMFNDKTDKLNRVIKSDYVPCLNVEEFYTDGWETGNCMAMVDVDTKTVWLSKNRLMGKQLFTNMATGEIYVPGKELLERLKALMSKQKIAGSNICISLNEALDILEIKERRIHFARLAQPPQTFFGKKFNNLRGKLMRQYFPE